MTAPRLYLPYEVECEIDACNGVYSQTDTARYFGVPWWVVKRIWNSGVDYPEVEPPNIWDAKPTADLIRQDVWTMYVLRGMSVQEIADYYGLSKPWITVILRSFAPMRDLDLERTPVIVPGGRGYLIPIKRPFTVERVEP